MKIMQFMASAKYVGAERSFVELCNELAKSDEVIAVVVKGCEYKDRFSRDVKVLELQSNSSRYNPFLYLELAKIIKKHKPTVVHAHSAKATQILYVLWKYMRFAFVATKRNSSRKATIFNKVPFAVGVSKEVVASIDNPSKALVYNGIEPKALGDVVKEDIFTMVAIGILQPRKGFAELIEAVQDLPFDFRLWIVGEGEQRGELQDLIKRFNLEEKVLLLGQREDTHLLQARAHLQIINSKREGFSRVLIEGFFYSDVVISTKVAGSTEMLPDIFLFDDPKEKIQEVFANYDFYKEQFGALKKQYQKRFTLANVAREYRKIYKRVAGV
ncbi:poly(glycerol-phosphate) alpha-glucosyltransferase [Nitratiruptor sp. YY08-26]|nr:poly(glycerol-phosphate) alpha-glucosyltransferase [Nitratiruptor sp. YY08-13]BCD66655.1 poly(glycerol-phosphate) alpha-glucosyltransferase [Nitratiruptor sp. YY08-26]